MIQLNQFNQVLVKLENKMRRYSLLASVRVDVSALFWRFSGHFPTLSLLLLSNRATVWAKRSPFSSWHVPRTVGLPVISVQNAAPKLDHPTPYCPFPTLSVCPEFHMILKNYKQKNYRLLLNFESVYNPILVTASVMISTAIIVIHMISDSNHHKITTIISENVLNRA